jgi:hypothetical protein
MLAQSKMRQQTLFCGSEQIAVPIVSTGGGGKSAIVAVM